MKDFCYGCFPGGDPREFTPDSEWCTPEEIEAHKRDCAAWDRGEKTTVPVSGMLPDGNGGVMHVSRSSYGLGVYSIEFEDEE